VAGESDDRPLRLLAGGQLPVHVDVGSPPHAAVVPLGPVRPLLVRACSERETSSIS
jgi:hypothetical protein